MSEVEIARLKAEIVRLQDENDELREAEIQRTKAVTSQARLIPRDWELTHKQRVILLTLLASPQHTASHERLRLAAGITGTPHALYAQIVLMRRCLRQYGFSIQCAYREGYRLPPETAAKIKAAMDLEARLDRERVETIAKIYGDEPGRLRA